MPTPRQIKVFIASPGDLAVERRAFKDTIDLLNNTYGVAAKIEFVPLGWEEAIYQYGRRPQSVINEYVDTCDVFILALWTRWGQPAKDLARKATSYTEEEFNHAVERWKEKQSPTIHIFFKNIDAKQMADPGPQCKKVLAFRKKIAKSKQVLGRPFEEEKAFAELLRTHLIAFAEKLTTGAAAQPPDEIMRAEYDELKKQFQATFEELAKLKAEAAKRKTKAIAAKKKAKTPKAKTDAAAELAKVSSETEALTLAESAARAALDGRIEDARQTFSKVLEGTTKLKIIYLGYEFYYRIGDLNEAERLLRQWLAISGPDAQTNDTAAAYGNLGNVLRTRGQIDRAEAMYRKSLAISEKLGELAGMAGAYGNLGLVLKSRGDLDGAEAMYRDGLKINEQLGRLEGVANNLNNLAEVLNLRGDWDGADAMVQRSIVIEEKLGKPDHIASKYGNLGVVLQARGDLKGAEAMYRKALAVHEKLGRLEGMAINNQNLGILSEIRKQLSEARHFWTRARDQFAKLGATPKVQKIQRWLDSLPPDDA
jgi:tetratricopeptide (TPR) repeat protein